MTKAFIVDEVTDITNVKQCQLKKGSSYELNPSILVTLTFDTSQVVGIGWESVIVLTFSRKTAYSMHVKT